MSLCHGPGCRREQTVPFWCSESCALNWAWLAGKPDAAAQELLERQDAMVCTFRGLPADPVVADAAAFSRATDAVTDLAESESAQVTPGWLSRALEALYGRTP